MLSVVNLSQKLSPAGALRFLWLMIALSIFSGCTFLNVNIVPPLSPLKEKSISGEGDNKILLVDIQGSISNKKKTSAMGGVISPGMVDQVREILKKAEKDEDIKALLLRINTPGGTVTSSDIIYHEIKTFKEKKKVKVYAMVMDLAASGGYYVAQAADHIIVHPTSLTGSIGVIALKLNLSGLMDKVGVDFEVVKSGDHKDFLSPFRPLTADERIVFQETIDTLHSRFVSVIEANRKEMSREQILQLADGRVYTSGQALKHKLVDQIAYVDEAERFIQKDLGLDSINVVTYYRKGQYKNNFYSSTSVPPAVNLNFLQLNFIPETPEPNFMYLWMP